MQHLAEIRQVVTTGRTPGGARVAPLPEPSRQQLLASLDRVAAGLEDIAKSFVPAWDGAAEETGGVAATRMWASILLLTIEELVEDLNPDKIGARYGTITEEESRALQGKAESVLAAVRQAMRLLE